MLLAISMLQLYVLLAREPQSHLKRSHRHFRHRHHHHLCATNASQAITDKYIVGFDSVCQICKKGEVNVGQKLPRCLLKQYARRVAVYLYILPFVFDPMDKDQSVLESVIHEEGMTYRNSHTDTLLHLRYHLR